MKLRVNLKNTWMKPKPPPPKKTLSLRKKEKVKQNEGNSITAINI